MLEEVFDQAGNFDKNWFDIYVSEAEGKLIDRYILKKYNNTPHLSQLKGELYP